MLASSACAVQILEVAFSRRCQQRQRQEVRAYGNTHPSVVRAGDERCQVLRQAVLVRILDERAEHARLECHCVNRPDV